MTCLVNQGTGSLPRLLLGRRCDILLLPQSPDSEGTSRIFPLHSQTTCFHVLTFCYIMKSEHWTAGCLVTLRRCTIVIGLLAL